MEKKVIYNTCEKCIIYPVKTWILLEFFALKLCNFWVKDHSTSRAKGWVYLALQLALWNIPTSKKNYAYKVEQWDYKANLGAYRSKLFINNFDGHF